MKRWSILAGACLAFVVVSPATAKNPGTTYCYKDVCHRVKTIGETASEVDVPQSVLASFYDAPERDRFNPGGLTSSGEVFRPLDHDTAASPVYPNGTKLLVYAPATGAAAVVRVNDAGPYWSGRLLDLSRGAAEKLGFAGRGLSHVITVVVAPPTEDEARYETNRSYARVPGYLGVFASLDAAKADWARRPEARSAAVQPTRARSDDGGSRVVVIGGAREPSSTSPGARKTKIVLRPVRLRRPHLLAALAKRKTKVAATSAAKR